MADHNDNEGRIVFDAHTASCTGEVEVYFADEAVLRAFTEGQEQCREFVASLRVTASTFDAITRSNEEFWQRWHREMQQAKQALRNAVMHELRAHWPTTPEVLGLAEPEAYPGDWLLAYRQHRPERALYRRAVPRLARTPRPVCRIRSQAARRSGRVPRGGREDYG